MKLWWWNCIVGFNARKWWKHWSWKKIIDWNIATVGRSDKSTQNQKFFFFFENQLSKDFCFLFDVSFRRTERIKRCSTGWVIFQVYRGVIWANAKVEKVMSRLSFILFLMTTTTTNKKINHLWPVGGRALWSCITSNIPVNKHKWRQTYRLCCRW